MVFFTIGPVDESRYANGNAPNGRFALRSFLARFVWLDLVSEVVSSVLWGQGATVMFETVVSYDGYGTNGSDAITVAYMEPSLVMNTTYSSIPTCTTSSLVFNPNHLDYFNKLMQFRSGDLLMCYDYAAK